MFIESGRFTFTLRKHTLLYVVCISPSLLGLFQLHCMNLDCPAHLIHYSHPVAPELELKKTNRQQASNTFHQLLEVTCSWRHTKQIGLRQRQDWRFDSKLQTSTILTWDTFLLDLLHVTSLLYLHFNKLYRNSSSDSLHAAVYKFRFPVTQRSQAVNPRDFTCQSLINLTEPVN